MEIYACQNSLHECSLKREDLVDGVKIDDGKVLVHALKNAQSVMIF
jgi:predicted peroxiredoxin